jgi:hypothetical protein
MASIIPDYMAERLASNKELEMKVRKRELHNEYLGKTDSELRFIRGLDPEPSSLEQNVAQTILAHRAQHHH